MIALVDTGGANLASVGHALARLGRSYERTLDPERIRGASHVILPGVGAAGASMERLRPGTTVELLRGLRQPVLGICLGMQLLFERSEEDRVELLGILPGEVRGLQPAEGRPVPHMGWNRVFAEGPPSPLFADVADGSHFYFVHSYAAPRGPWVRASCHYGAAFPACVQRENFHGVQFHPERSGEAGARVLAGFLAL